MQVQHAQPHLERGIAYWQGVEASVNGVLGGYGLGTLPVVDSIGTRTFILSILSHLVLAPPATESDPLAWLKQRAEARARRRAPTSQGGLGPLGRTRALDVGAGVGRVSRDTLLPLVEEVHMVEPVRKFLDEAKRTSIHWDQLSYSQPKPSTSTTTTKSGKPKRKDATEEGRKAMRELVRAAKGRKSAYFWENTMQDFDPARPAAKAGSSPIDPTFAPDEESIARAQAEAEAQSSEAQADAPVDGDSEQQNKKRRTASSSANGSSKSTPTASTLSGKPAHLVVPGTSIPLVSVPPELGLPLSSGGTIVKYDVILIQWCAQHLKDSEMIAFLQRCRAALKTRAEMLGPEGDSAPPSDTEKQGPEDPLADPGLDGGLLVIKENVCTEDADGNERVEWDDTDHSITRSRKAYERLFAEAGMRIIKTEEQLGLPDELFEVRQWALR